MSSKSQISSPRPATAHYTFREHRSIAEIDAANRALTRRFAAGA